MNQNVQVEDDVFEDETQTESINICPNCVDSIGPKSPPNGLVAAAAAKDFAIRNKNSNQNHSNSSVIIMEEAQSKSDPQTDNPKPNSDSKSTNSVNAKCVKTSVDLNSVGSSLTNEHSPSPSPSARRWRTYSIANPVMPWFGIDVGGTLTKLVYFEPTDQSDFDEGTIDGEKERLQVIRKYLLAERTYGQTGVRDQILQMQDIPINCRTGILHFIHFPTHRVPAFISLVKSKGFARLSTTACATGGGAHKFAKDIEQDLELHMHKFDELETLIMGIGYVVDHNTAECYYWTQPLSDENSEKKTWQALSEGESALQYPYLVVNMGSGVSIVAVYGNNNYKRVSGSSIGGGFFAGLCSLLTGCSTFEEAIQLATQGDNTKVDKLVRDIYGGDYTRIGLSGDTVAASFGHMIDADRRKEASPADLARAALVTVTNNIGGIAINCARNENIQTILFVGNFLRVNPIASRQLAYAMNFWSNGVIKALFLQHEGYFGAVGCLRKLTEQQLHRRQRDRENRSQSDDSASAASLNSIT